MNSNNFQIPGAMPLVQFSYIEEHVGLDCGIEYLGKNITATLLIANHNQLCQGWNYSCWKAISLLKV